MMKALSFKEPYASLMLHGKVETRTWSTDYRGWVLLCASKQPYSEGQVKMISGFYQIERIWQHTTFNGYKNGYAYAIGYLTDCRPMTPQDNDKCFVQYRSSLFCHIYKEVTPIQPFPWKGALGWQEVPEEVLKRLKSQYSILNTKYNGNDNTIQQRSEKLGIQADLFQSKAPGIPRKH